ncbi:PfkB family carbohydrate kinase [Micromonospora sp. M12]
MDPGAPTGLYLKDPGPEGTAVHYYRAGSAASRMTPATLADPALAGARVLHLSGITAALSASCRELVTHAVTDRPLTGRWSASTSTTGPGSGPPSRPRRCCATSPTAATSSSSGRTRRRRCGHDRPDRRTPVVAGAGDGGGQGRRGRCHHAGPRCRTGLRARARVTVVEPVGAGDAFAAGYLAGLLRGLDAVRRLRLGHLMAAQALTSSGDNAPSRPGPGSRSSSTPPPTPGRRST